MSVADHRFCFWAVQLELIDTGRQHCSPGGPILPADEIILAQARSHTETNDLSMYASA
jgi:hypothetical protein